LDAPQGPARLGFALERHAEADWSSFQTFATAFLSTDLPNIRELAGTGDKGRDAVLFETDDPAVVLQYSVERDWKRKIKATTKRLDAASACSRRSSGGCRRTRRARREKVDRKRAEAEIGRAGPESVRDGWFERAVNQLGTLGAR
jgi:hypothetical protein